MRFASLGGQGNYAIAGRAVAQDAAKSFKAGRDNATNFGEIAKAAMQARSNENIAAIQSEAQVTKAGITSKASVEKTKQNIKRDEIVRGSRRKAGMVAAMGKAGAGIADLFVGKSKTKTDDSASIALEERLRNRATSLREGIQPINFNNDSSTNTNTDAASNTGNPPKTTGGSSEPEQQQPGQTVAPNTASNTTWTSQQQSAFDITGKYESDSYGGYEAFNLGGSNQGRTAHGSGNSSTSSPFGGPLTSLTIGQIKNLQSQGQLHAAGRYQFIGNSLPEAAQFAGLSDSDVFTPENQNRMFLAFGNRYGTGRWVGLENASDEERQTVQTAFNNYSP